MSRAALALATLALLAGCDLSMTHQPKRGPLESETLWPGGPARMAPPEGTIDLAAPARMTAFATQPPMTRALVERGRERYAIDCAMCHGARGDGDGAVVRRGFPRPAPFASTRLKAAPAAHIVDVITNGYGVMYGHADRVAPADRWAITAYVRALQRLGPTT